MAPSVFDKIQKYINSLPDAIEKGMAAVTIRAVDRYVWEFYERVKRDIPGMLEAHLSGVITLSRIFKRGRYGYRLSFEGYMDEKKKIPLQMIANVFNYGRVAGSGIAESGRRYAFGDIQAIKFMSNNLELLKGIDREIGQNMNIGGWSVSDDKITINDGTSFSWAEVEKYDKLMQGAG